MTFNEEQKIILASIADEVEKYLKKCYRTNPEEEKNIDWHFIWDLWYDYIEEKIIEIINKAKQE